MTAWWRPHRNLQAWDPQLYYEDSADADRETGLSASSQWTMVIDEPTWFVMLHESTGEFLFEWKNR